MLHVLLWSSLSPAIFLVRNYMQGLLIGILVDLIRPGEPHALQCIPWLPERGGSSLPTDTVLPLLIVEIHQGNFISERHRTHSTHVRAPLYTIADPSPTLRQSSENFRATSPPRAVSVSCQRPQSTIDPETIATDRTRFAISERKL